MIPSIVCASARSQRRQSTHSSSPADAGRVVRLERDERLPVARSVLGELADGVQQRLDHVRHVLLTRLVVHREPHLVQAVLAGEAVRQAAGGRPDRPPRERGGAQHAAGENDQQRHARTSASRGVRRGARAADTRRCAAAPQVRELGEQHREADDAHEQTDEQQQRCRRRAADHARPPRLEDGGEREQHLDCREAHQHAARAATAAPLSIYSTISSAQAVISTGAYGQNAWPAPHRRRRAAPRPRDRPEQPTVRAARRRPTEVSAAWPGGCPSPGCRPGQRRRDPHGDAEDEPRVVKPDRERFAGRGRGSARSEPPAAAGPAAANARCVSSASTAPNATMTASTSTIVGVRRSMAVIAAAPRRSPAARAAPGRPSHRRSPRARRGWHEHQRRAALVSEVRERTHRRAAPPGWARATSSSGRDSAHDPLQDMRGARNTARARGQHPRDVRRGAERGLLRRPGERAHVHDASAPCAARASLSTRRIASRSPWTVNCGTPARTRRPCCPSAHSAPAHGLARRRSLGRAPRASAVRCTPACAARPAIGPPVSATSTGAVDCAAAVAAMRYARALAPAPPDNPATASSGPGAARNDRPGTNGTALLACGAPRAIAAKAAVLHVRAGSVSAFRARPPTHTCGSP